MGYAEAEISIFWVGTDRTLDPGVSKQHQSGIKTKILTGGADRTLDPGVSKHSRSRIKAEILTEGADRTLNPGVSKDVTFQPYSPPSSAPSSTNNESTIWWNSLPRSTPKSSKIGSHINP